MRAWGPVTVRVAWWLVAHGYEATPDALRDLRDHVMWRLPADATPAAAEDLAGALIPALVARTSGRRHADPHAEDRALALRPDWVRELAGASTGYGAWVYRLHYGDDLPLDAVAARVGADVAALTAVRDGLRLRLIDLAAADGVALERWAPDRLDALLARLANVGLDGGPPLLELADGRHAAWLRACTRGRRALQLVRWRVLRRDDLAAPLTGAAPMGTTRVLVLQLHPRARGRLKAVARALPGLKTPVGEDVLLAELRDDETVHAALAALAREARPARDQLRGAILEGPGRWSRLGLLGPLADTAPDAVRAVPWGVVSGLPELPEPAERLEAPWPPWLAPALGVVALGFLVSWALPKARPAVDHPLEVVTVPARGGLWVDFDVDDLAHVGIVRQLHGKLEVLGRAERPVDKIVFATGDGGFRLHAEADAVLVASAARAVPDLRTWAEEASLAPAPLAALEARLRAEVAGVDVVTATR